MKPKTMILMGLAVTCGLGASYMTSRLLAERQPTDEAKVTVLVAKRTLSVGEPIRKPEDMFELKQFPAGQEPKDAIQVREPKQAEKDLEALKGKIMKQSLRKDDHVTMNDVSGDGGLQIPEGYYACGFPVNMVSSASGFASLPLSRVDILLVIKRSDDKNSQARVLLENVLVLAADTDIDRSKGIAAPAQVVTFALKPEEALKVQMAKEMGILTLALRKQGDRTMTKIASVSAESILSNDGKKDDETGSVPEVPKMVGKPAPTVLPTAASKPSVEPPPVAQAPQPTPVPEAPKTVANALLLQNGNRQERIRYQTSEDGHVVGEEGGDSGPTPPRKQLAPKRDDF